MTEHKAYQILNCNQTEDVIDAYEEGLFSFKSKFLQQIPPLKIIDAYILKIEKLNSAYHYFYPDNIEVNTKITSLNLAIDMSSFLDNYQSQLAQLRLQIANTQNGVELIKLLYQLKSIQHTLFFKLESYINIQIDTDKYPVKLSEEIDVFAIQSNLKDLNLEEAKISEYIRTQITDNNFELFSALTKAVINAKKQIKFNELTRKI